MTIAYIVHIGLHMFQGRKLANQTSECQRPEVNLVANQRPKVLYNLPVAKPSVKSLVDILIL